MVFDKVGKRSNRYATRSFTHDIRTIIQQQKNTCELSSLKATKRNRESSSLVSSGSTLLESKFASLITTVNLIYLLSLSFIVLFHHYNTQLESSQSVIKSTEI